ncbi:MAG TPA: OsmC family peroxiredoxin [Bacteroidales bacterium]|nr:OsmC family peroxiredoxin [Bacteroidales bacterium]
MSRHYANANWEGNLKEGKGKYTLKASGLQGTITFSSRFGDDRSASSPEELIGAALASCFSMALANDLDSAGFKPTKIETSADVQIAKTDNGFGITEIVLNTIGRVSNIEKEKFLEIAEKTKKNCPVSKALTGTQIKLEARLAEVSHVG